MLPVVSQCAGLLGDGDGVAIGVAESCGPPAPSELQSQKRRGVGSVPQLLSQRSIFCNEICLIIMEPKSSAVCS